MSSYNPHPHTTLYHLFRQEVTSYIFNLITQLEVIHQSLMDQPPAVRSSSGKCNWTDRDTIVLMDYLWDRRTEFGDGHFKKSIYDQAVAVVNRDSPPTPGSKLKDGRSAKGRFRYSKADFSAIRQWQNTFGVHYDHVNGANIQLGDTESLSVFNEWTSKPGRDHMKKFHNKGWDPHLYDMMAYYAPEGMASRDREYRPVAPAAGGTAAAAGTTSQAAGQDLDVNHTAATGEPMDTGDNLNDVAGLAGHGVTATGMVTGIPGVIVSAQSHAIATTPTISSSEFPWASDTNLVPPPAHPSSAFGSIRSFAPSLVISSPSVAPQRGGNKRSFSTMSPDTGSTHLSSPTHLFLSIGTRPPTVASSLPPSTQGTSKHSRTSTSAKALARRAGEENRSNLIAINTVNSMINSLQDKLAVSLHWQDPALLAVVKDATVLLNEVEFNNIEDSEEEEILFVLTQHFSSSAGAAAAFLGTKEKFRHGYLMKLYNKIKVGNVPVAGPSTDV